MTFRSPGLIALALWAHCGLAVAAEPPATAPTTEQHLEAAMTVYAESAMETLAASESPRERWFAGLMLLGESMRPKGSAEQADALRTRAQVLLATALENGKDDPALLFWAILDPPLRDDSDSEAMAEARLAMTRRLQSLEPKNAAVWLGGLPPRDQPGSIPVAIELLQKAAASERMDTHFADSMRLLIAAFGRVPLPADWPDTHQLRGWQGVQREDLPVILAVGVASALAMPYLAPTQAWCSGNQDEQPWLDDCRKLARIMVDHSDSIVPHSMALALLAGLHAADSETAKRAMASRRELAWWVENGLQRVGPGQPVSFAAWRSAWMVPGATELGVARKMVEAQGLPRTPPADFVPAWDR